jgi:hypothetical protein
VVCRVDNESSLGRFLFDPSTDSATLSLENKNRLPTIDAHVFNQPMSFDDQSKWVGFVGVVR